MISRCLGGYFWKRGAFESVDRGKEIALTDAGGIAQSVGGLSRTKNRGKVNLLSVWARMSTIFCSWTLAPLCSGLWAWTRTVPPAFQSLQLAVSGSWTSQPLWLCEPILHNKSVYLYISYWFDLSREPDEYTSISSLFSPFMTVWEKLGSVLPPIFFFLFKTPLEISLSWLQLPPLMIISESCLQSCFLPSSHCMFVLVPAAKPTPLMVHLPF